MPMGDVDGERRGWSGSRRRRRRTGEEGSE